jgi:hypothetical protein
MGRVLLLCFAAMASVMTVLLLDRYHLERLRCEVSLLTSETESRDLEQRHRMARERV